MNVDEALASLNTWVLNYIELHVGNQLEIKYF